jgi:uncharacterized protein (DUF779 family)
MAAAGDGHAQLLANAQPVVHRLRGGECDGGSALCVRELVAGVAL